MCISQIAGHSVKYEDQEFTDPVTKEKYLYQARVYTGTIRLQSSFWPNSVNNVNCSVWFQADLPYPGVDLTKLKPRQSDVYPMEIVDYIKNNEFLRKYEEVLGYNFGSDYDATARLFDQCIMMDQYTARHMLPFYLSKVTNPD